MTKAIIYNCHEASIQRDPTDPNLQDDILATVKAGTKLNVDFSKVYWSWNDKQYYKCEWGSNPEEGYINANVVKVV